MTVAGLVSQAAAALPGADARFDAELLLGHALGRDRAWLYAHANDVVDAPQRERFAALCAERARGVPVAQLLGRRGFWTLDLGVTADTLVPRPETELLVESGLARIPAGAAWRIADLGTGTGAIALSLALERPRCQVTATDSSTAALAVARGNAQRHGIANVEFVHGDWLAPLHGRRFELIASNPPYIAEGDPHLRQGDLRFEPLQALASGRDGLDALRTIAAGAAALLVPGGWLLLEHGHAQGAAVRELLASGGFIDVETALDLEQRERVSMGRTASR